MLPSNIHVTKGREAESHLVLICSDLNYDVTCTCIRTFMGGSQEAKIPTLVWIRWNNSMMKNQMIWWKKDSKNKENAMFALCSWELGHAIDHVRTVLRCILSLTDHIITKIAAAHVPCPYQWCGVRCSCSLSKMIAQGWPKLYIVSR